MNAQKLIAERDVQMLTREAVASELDQWYKDSLDSAQSRRSPDDLTEDERMAICIAAGVKVKFESAPFSGLNTYKLVTVNPVEIQWIDGRWQVFVRAS